MKVKWLARLTVVSGLLFCLQAAQFQAQRSTALLVGMLVTVGLTVLLGYLTECTRRSESRRMPIVAVQATLCLHRTEYVRDRYRRSHDLMYFVTFRTADHHILEFRVSRLNYKDFDVGETGELRYRGNEFLSFGLMDKSDIPPMMPLPDEYDQPLQPMMTRLQRFGTWMKHRRSRRVSADAGSTSSTERERNRILTHELEDR